MQNRQEIGYLLNRPVANFNIVSPVDRLQSDGWMNGFIYADLSLLDKNTVATVITYVRNIEALFQTNHVLQTSQVRYKSRINVSFIDKDGERFDFQVAEGDNLLDIAQANDLEMEGSDMLHNIFQMTFLDWL